MRNIDRIREMETEQLIDFLIESGAELPTDFCDIFCQIEKCDDCKYCGDRGDKEAWRAWLEKDDGEQEPQKDYKKLYTQLAGMVYGPEFDLFDPKGELIPRIEKALGFRLFIWQKTLIFNNTLRRTGLTTAECVRALIRDSTGSGILKIAKPRNHREEFEIRELLRIKKLLDAEGIKTNKIQTYRKTRNTDGLRGDRYEAWIQAHEQNTREQGGGAKEADGQVDQRQPGSGPADWREQ